MKPVMAGYRACDPGHPMKTSPRFALLALIPLLSVAGCAGTPKPAPTPPAPATTAPPAPAPTSETAFPARTEAYRAPPLAFPPGTSTASRIVQVALREHGAWYQPFIDTAGRLASRRVAEAERSKLYDGDEPWARVASYWRDSGTLAEMISSNQPGAYHCQNPYGSTFARNECRAFIVDTAWSAAFVSYVMAKAGVPGFRHSPRHMDYIRAAYRGSGPYAYRDPNTTPVAPGDLLCYLRNNGAIPGHGGLSGFLASSNAGLASHCDIAVAIHDRQVWTIGGNVANMVTLRKIMLDPQGRALLPRPISNDWVPSDEDGQSPACTPANEAACSMNRQNWAVLLKLVET